MLPLGSTGLQPVKCVCGLNSFQRVHTPNWEMSDKLFQFFRFEQMQQILRLMWFILYIHHFLNNAHHPL